MLIIDLRPYEGKETKPLKQLLEEHIKHIRGASQVIYSYPDHIFMTEKQAKELNIKTYKCEGIDVVDIKNYFMLVL